MLFVSEETKQLIKDAVDVESLLITLGFRITRVADNEVRATCRLHGGDNPTAFCMRLDSKKWCCYTHKCEQDATGRTQNDVVALVMRTNGLSFLDALQYLADFSGVGVDVHNPSPEESSRHHRQRDMTKYVRAAARLRDRAAPLPQLSEEVVRRYIANRDDYFLVQGFLPQTLEKFEIGAMTDRFGVRRATIPIRDHTGALVSVSARREDNDEDPRYRLEHEFQKGRVLYNLHRALTTGAKNIILVEGFKAAWAVSEAGFENVAACMGADITHEQVLLLCTCGLTGCVLMYDGDPAGRKGMTRALSKLEGAFRVVPVYLPEGLSPDSYEQRDELADVIRLYLEAL